MNHGFVSAKLAGVVVAVEPAAYQPRSSAVDAIVRLDDGSTIRIADSDAAVGDRVEVQE
jgi:hypothetical protein